MSHDSNANSRPNSSLPVLPQVKINSPCSMDWDEMDGDQARRFCGTCQKHVHNFQEMKSNEVEELMASDQNLCAKIARRADGSIITKDSCSTPPTREILTTRRGWLARIAGMAASALAILTLSGCNEQAAVETGEPQPTNASTAPVILGQVQSTHEMGDIVYDEMGGASANPDHIRIGKVAAEPKKEAE